MIAPRRSRDSLSAAVYSACSVVDSTMYLTGYSWTGRRSDPLTWFLLFLNTKTFLTMNDFDDEFDDYERMHMVSDICDIIYTYL